MKVSRGVSQVLHVLKLGLFVAFISAASVFGYRAFTTWKGQLCHSLPAQPRALVSTAPVREVRATRTHVARHMKKRAHKKVARRAHRHKRTSIARR